ncbi:hypothetical protein [Mangrovimonas sp. ST2L15]|uniref:hypothetical protein n=1 Tax=Mangrovimonas sp. ST2L15 TaxID=1645916 RepID=UPI0006B58737|nr:hypothetical protein [Mangrovimonas sp. ST2L15]
MEYINSGYVPIDFIKAKVVGMKPEDFENNPNLGEPKSIYDGELLTKTIYKYKNLIIKIFQNGKRIEFSGSLHVFYNDGKHNYNDFTLRQFKASLALLKSCLGISPENLYLLHLEWGYNLIPPRRTNDILDSLIQHVSVNKTVGIDCKIEGKYIQFKHSNMILKVYNKGKQFKLDTELIRIEIKQTNWSRYRAMGLKTLKDFILFDKSIFFNELLVQWDKIIMFDLDINKAGEDLKYNGSRYWDELRRSKSRKGFKYHFDKLKRLNLKNGFDTVNKIKNELIKKGNELQL